MEPMELTEPPEHVEPLEPTESVEATKPMEPGDNRDLSQSQLQIKKNKKTKKVRARTCTCANKLSNQELQDKYLQWPFWGRQKCNFFSWALYIYIYIYIYLCVHREMHTSD